jgi:hypothetical protein
MTASGKHGSVQDLLPLEDIVEGVICLRGGEYRAVIQAQSVNCALKSEEEQEAVIALPIGITFHRSGACAVKGQTGSRRLGGQL